MKKQSLLNPVKKQKRAVAFLGLAAVLFAYSCYNENRKNDEIAMLTQLFDGVQYLPEKSKPNIQSRLKKEPAVPFEKVEVISESSPIFKVGKPAEKQLLLPEVSIQTGQQTISAPSDGPKELNYGFSENLQGIIGKSEEFPIDDPGDNTFTVLLETALDDKKEIYLVYELYGLADASGASVALNDNFSRGGYLVKRSKNWITHKERINPDELIEGINFVRFSTLPSADYAYMIKNIRFEVSDLNIGEQSIALNQTELKSYNGSVYLSGFADKSFQSVMINGKEIGLRNGVFEAVVENAETEIVISAAGQDYHFPVSEETEESPDKITLPETQNKTASAYFTAWSENTISDFGATLNVPAESMEKDQTFYLSALRFQDVSALSPEMVNVTANHSGFRLLPHGEHFINSPATLEIPYDETKIPAGYKPQDIKTFYFDNRQRKWIALERDTVLLDKKIIVSKTTHFTDFVNGIIKVPESPETGSFTPTSIKDIKAADPAAGVVSIAPPTPNNMGTATTSFPIKLPAGRAGMQPSLSVNYNSEGGNGWMGIGWDLSVPSISIDTRWGVPRYDTTNCLGRGFETEIYTISGEMLTLKNGNEYTNPHRTADICRMAERQFYPRIEGSYAKIIRHGSNPTNYWWEVTDKMGNKSFYGGYTGLGVVNNAVIKTSDGNIAHWALYRTEDTNGNYVQYSYDKGDGQYGHEFYPKDISYTRHTDQQTPKYYKVSFELDSEIPSSSDRIDIQTNARLGLVQSTSKLLNEIKIELTDGLNPEKIRSYRFDYETKAFSKKQLIKISEFDANDQLFYSNTMDYFDEVRSGNYYEMFEPAQQWTLPVDNNEVSALGGTENESNFFGLAVTAGIADFNPVQKNLTGGGNYVNSSGKSQGIATLYDINGDGLPDKILSNLDYRANLSQINGTILFDNTLQSVSGYSGNFLNQKNKSRAWGTEFTLGYGVFAFNAGDVNTKSSNRTQTYIADVNGDGIMDIIRNKTVYFGYLTSNGVRYSTNSGNTPNRIDGGVAVQGGGMSNPEDEEPEIRQQNPVMEIVKVWKAPYDGAVKLNLRAFLQAFPDPENEYNEDGIRLRVERGGASSPIVNTIISPGNSYSSSPSTVFSVTKGDYFFFRISAIDNGQHDVLDWENTNGETFVNYVGIPPNALTLPHSYNDADNLSYHQFSIPKKELYYTDGISAIAPGYTGSNNVQVSAVISGIINKTGVTSDNIKITFYKGTNGNYTAQGTSINLDYDFTGLQNINRTISGLNIGSTDANGNIIVPPNSLKVVFSADSNVDWSKLDVQNLKVKFTYSTNEQIYDFIPEYKFYNWQKQGPNLTNYPAPPHKVTVASSSLSFKPKLEFSAPVNGSYKLIVKKLSTTGSILDVKRATVNIVNGSVANTVSIPMAFAVNDLLYFEYTTNTPALIEATSLAQVTTSLGTVVNIGDILASANVFLIDSNDLYLIINGENYTNTVTDARFGTMYRSWGSFAYNGGWGNYLHPENPNYSNLPIEVNELWLPTEDNIEEYQSIPLYERRWFMLTPYVSSFVSLRWLGPDTDIWANGITVSTGRMGIDDIEAELEPPYSSSTPGQYGAVAIDKVSSSRDSSESFGGSVLGIGLTKTKSVGDENDSEIETEFMDMNGDRYPDIVSKTSIQYTNMRGGLTSETVSTGQNFFITHSSEGLGAGGYVPSSYFTDSNSGQTGTANKAAANIQRSGENAKSGSEASKLSASFSPGAALSDNSDEQISSISDINGDGLPDKLLVENGKVWVQLNLGYSFAPKKLIDNISNIRNGKGVTYPTSASAAFSLGNASISGGLSKTEGVSMQAADFEDINGDGLLDKIEGDKVYLNTGNSFVMLPLASGYFNNGFSNSVSKGSGINGAFTFCVNVPIVFLKFCGNPSLGSSDGINSESLKLLDINGDGYPDIVSSNQDGTLSVRLNKTGKTHLLKRVNLPLGGHWEIDYEREQNSYEMPNAKWKMTHIEVYDGFTADNAFTPDVARTSAEYENPRHDRREREFMGYEKVKVNQLDVNNGDEIYRYSVQEFHTNSHYLKGAVKKESLYDKNDVLWTSTETTYAIMARGNTNPANVIKPSDYVFNSGDFNTAVDKASLFVSPIKTTKKFTEGGGGLKTTFTEIQAFDAYGNITQFMDNGEGGNDVVTSYINYQTSGYDTPYFKGYPLTIRVIGADGSTRQREAAYDFSGGTANLTSVKTRLTGSETASVSFDYDDYGNIEKVTHEESKDENDNPFYYEYTYDNQLHTYPVKIEDAFGYSSQNTYDYRFGALVYTEDMNYKPMRTRIDNRGRVVEITGPYELFVEGLTTGDPAWTIRFEYEGEPTVASRVANIEFTDYVIDASGSFAASTDFDNPQTAKKHHAVTRHFDPEFRNSPETPLTENEIYTITLIDGLGKPVQVKKSTSIKTAVTNHNGDITKTVIDARDTRKWLVNGKVETDAFGRAVKTWYPILEDYNVSNPFNTAALSYNATAYETGENFYTEATYDVLDRVKTTKLPGETAEMLTSYSIEAGLFKTTVVNELNQTKHSFTDVRGRTTKVVEDSNDAGTITTEFTYNALSELIKVEDTDGNITESFYDMAGRRTELRHPDNGITKFTYDNASNLIAKETANLLAENNAEKIEYFYTFNRLDSIVYPKYPHNNVHFFYGQAEDASAVDDFSVGRLWYQIDATGVQQFKYGRLGEVRYNLRSVAVPGDKAYWFKTEWEYDTWNRVKKIIYPDEEEVSYFYNRGGELHAITSKKQEQQNEDIISQLGYDKFGQRTYLRYGNGTETEYSYEAERRRLQNMTAKSNTTYGSSVNRTFINNNYSYDILSNVLSVENTAALPTTGQIGGSVLYEYGYDDLNRLETADAIFTGRNSTDNGYEQQKYSLLMEYDNLHNIVSKEQLHQKAPGQTGGIFTDIPATTYRLDYAYEANNKPHAPRTIIDKPYANSTGNDIKTKTYNYDANGNMISLTQKTGESDVVEKLRTNLWDEENRLRAVDITPDAEGVRPIAIYTYDAGGERILKHSNTSVSIFLNGKKVADTIQTNAMLYPSGMLVGKLGNNGSEEEQTLAYTKHYYAGTQRVSSKIGTTENLGDFLQDWFTGGIGGPVDIIGSSFGVLENAEQGVIQVYHELEIEAPEYDSSPVFIPVQSFVHGGNEVEQYFFHPDHLGSTSYITNLLGEVSQHMEYFAFGETFVEEHRSSNNSPYKFNGKELDEETGLYYYGARYYDPRVSVWLSVDPLAEETMTPYQYTYQNPVRYIDPTGMAAEDPQGDPPTKSGNYINHNAQSIRIYRNIYFESDEDYQANKNALEQWNSFSGKSTYITDDKLEYSLYLNLNPVILKNGRSSTDAILEDIWGLSIWDLNDVDFVNTALEWNKQNIDMGGKGLDHDANNGQNLGGLHFQGKISQRMSVATDDSRAHEIGHGLGLGHSSGVMAKSMDKITPVKHENYNDVFKTIFKRTGVHPSKSNLNSPWNGGVWNVKGIYKGRGNFINDKSYKRIKKR